MFAGGKLSATDQKELLSLQDRISEQEEILAQLNDQLNNSSQTVTDVGQQEGLALQSEEADKNAVEAAEKQLEDFQHQIDDFKNQLEISQNNVARAFDLANFFRNKYLKDFADDQVQASLEAYFESRNNQLEAFVAAIGSFFNFASVEAGLGYRGKSEFTPVKYLQPKEAAQDQSPEYYAQAQSQDSDYQAQLNRLGEMESDPYYSDRLSEVQGDYTESQTQHDDLSAQQDEARADNQDVRDSIFDAQRVLRGLSGDMRAIQRKGVEED